MTAGESCLNAVLAFSTLVTLVSGVMQEQCKWAGDLLQLLNAAKCLLLVGVYEAVQLSN